jgi:hypothetical protein
LIINRNVSFRQGVLAGLQLDELEPLIANTEPDGLFI